MWGDDDQLGNLNELSPELTLKALSQVEDGKVYDLGLMYDRNSYKFEGHNYGEIISFRSPDGLNTQEDLAFVTSEEDNSLEHDVGEQRPVHQRQRRHPDRLFRPHLRGSPPKPTTAPLRGDPGRLRPPQARRRYHTSHCRPGHDDRRCRQRRGKIRCRRASGSGPTGSRPALDDQGVDIDPLDVVLVRTGTAGVWLDGDGVGANNEEVAKFDSAGLTVSGAKWLVEEKGALAVGTDTSGIEVLPPKEQLDGGPASTRSTCTCSRGRASTSSNTITRRGWHKDEVYKFAYVLGVNKIKGAAAGTVLRPIGIV